jgi:hypothetical protein
MTFESKLIFDDARIHAAAVYCSDGRFGEMMDDFLMNHLRLPRYDRLAVPGGAAALAGHFATYREEEAELEQLRFLAEVHGLERVILIAHQGCAYYSERLKVSPIDLKGRQLEDLQKATRRVRALDERLRVEPYFASLDAHVVRFEPI